MTVQDNGDWGRTAETFACGVWPAFERISGNGHSRPWADVVAREPIPEADVDAGTHGDVKACRVRISDGDPESSERSGRWWFARHNHDVLLERGGVYVLVVYTVDDGPIEAEILGADAVDILLDGRWVSNGDGGKRAEESAQLPWTDVIAGVA